MRKAWVCLIGILACSFASYGQGAALTNVILGPNVQVRPNAQVYICTHPSTVLTCPANVISLFSDIGLTVPTTNPTMTNAQGQFLAFAAAGTYDYIVVGPGITPQQEVFTMTVGGGGGGAGNPAPPAAALQLANSGVTGFATASSGGNAVGVNSASSPTQLNVPNGISFANGGPRPYIDVTAPPYNADPTGVTLANSAIQSAINSACAFGFGNRPSVQIPYGVYSVQQTQTGVSATAPIFNLCSGLMIYGTGSLGTQDQGAMPPAGAKIVVTAGASPNNAPVFLISNIGGGSGPFSAFNSAIENLAIDGYNQGIWVQSTSNVILKNLSINVVQTGQTDNTPLKISNTIWIWLDSFQFDVGGGGVQTVPTMILSGETPSAGEQNFVNLLFATNGETHGGGFQYIQRSNLNAGVPNSLNFENITQENSAQPFLQFLESTPGYLMAIENLYLAKDVQADGAGNTMVDMDVSSGQLINVTLTQDQDPIGVQLHNSSTVRGFNSWASGPALDPSGNYAGGNNTFMQSSSGLGITSGSSATAALPCNTLSGCSTGGPGATFVTGNTVLSNLALDSAYGVLFGNQSFNGYSAALQQNTNDTLDVMTANYLPPTSISGTATTGGSLSAGTYYGVIWSTQGASASGCPQSFPARSTLQYFPAVTVSGINNAVNFAWSLPAASFASFGAIAGYCLSVGTSFNFTPSQAIFVSGGSTTSFLYTGQSQTGLGTVYPTSPLVATDRFCYNGLSVGNTSCSPGLNVTGPITLSGTLTSTALGGSGTQCMHFNNAGIVSGTGSDCGSGGGSGVNVTVNGGSNLASPANFQNGPAFQGLTINAINPSGSNVDFQLSGVATEALLPAASVFTDQPATFGAHNYDFSGATLFKIPVSPGAAPTANGQIAYDSTANQYNFGVNGSTVHYALSNAAITIAGTSVALGGSTTSFPSPGAIGGTTPAAGNFTTLGATGNLTTNVTGGGTQCLHASNTGVVSGAGSDCGADLSGMTAGQVPIAATASTVTSSKALSGSGSGITTGPASGVTSGDLVDFTGTGGQIADSGVLASSLLSNPMTTLGDMIDGGASGTPTRVVGPTSPNGVPQFLTDTPSGGAATAETFSLAGVPVNNNSETTCASQTLNVLDRATAILCSGGTTATFTFPVHTTSGFGSNFPMVIANNNSGTMTLTPTTDTIDNGTLLSKWATFAYNNSSGNWQTIQIPQFAAFGSTCANALLWSTTTGFSCLGYLPVGAATTNTFTNKTFDTNGTGNVLDIASTQITAIQGNTGTIATASGAYTSGNCLKSDANHNIVDAGAACAGSGSPGGSSGQIQYNNSGAFGGSELTYSTHTFAGASTTIWDLHSATGTAAFLVPSNTTNTTSAAAAIDFDTTNKNFHGFVNGADSIFLNIAAAPTNNDCLKASVSSGNTLVADAGSPCATVTSVGLVGTANQVTVTGTSPITSSGSFTLSLPAAVNLGTDNSTAGTIQLANGSANAHTILGSVATTSNTFDFPATVFTNNHIGYCAVSSTTCTWTDAGYAYNAVPAADIASGALANGMTATTQTAASNDTKLATDAYVDGHFIANGTFTLNTAAVASGACETVVTVSATGVATTDVVSVGFNGDPTAVTGYGASATGAVLSIYPYPTTNNVNVKVCNSTANSITPSAMTLNWKVTR